MRKAHRYALVNSPGRVPTTAGAVSLTLGVAAAALLGLGGALLEGFGAWGFMQPVQPLGAGTTGVATGLLLAYPALYALSLLGEAWSAGAFLNWLGRRVRGSFCLLWSTLVAAIVILHIAEGHTWAAALVPGAAMFAVGGVAVRWIERQANPSWQPFARMLPAALLTFASATLATVGLASGLLLGPLHGLIASAVLVGSLLLLVGSTRDVLHRRQTSPRKIFCRDSMHGALRIS